MAPERVCREQAFDSQQRRAQREGGTGLRLTHRQTQARQVKFAVRGIAPRQFREVADWSG